jgi:hypothetical protein
LIEALSDYLLALRGLLEGGGPANAALAARVAVLACRPEDRESARVCVERALVIERKLMSGGRFRPAAASPLDVIAELEELLRRLLKGMATGELHGDLRAAADELLLGEGLSAGQVENPPVGETAEWRIPDPAPDEKLDFSGIADAHVGEIEIRRNDPETGVETGSEEVVRGREEYQPTTTRIIVDDVELPEIMGANSDHREAPEPNGKADWFSGGDGEVDWPAFASPRRDRGQDRKRPETSDQVRYLFPVPDSTDWDVGELRYERKQR